MAISEPALNLGKRSIERCNFHAQLADQDTLHVRGVVAPLPFHRDHVHVFDFRRDVGEEPGDGILQAALASASIR